MLTSRFGSARESARSPREAARHNAGRLSSCSSDVRSCSPGGGEYAIHGTNNPGSVGGFVSYGCIRMYNADVLDLYNRVSWGAPVVVTR
jgi:L,D-transpeptidase catalytic domain